MKKIIVIALLAICFASASFADVLNFDQSFGTQSWSEDGHSWSWDNTGWDNIRNYNPHTGSGHAMSASGYHSKLSSNGMLNIQGIWLKTDFASSFTHLHLKGYSICGKLIYDVTLNPMDYEFGYAYVTLNWTNVKSFMVDYNSVSQMNPVELSYDDMDYTFTNANNVLNFDEPFGTQSWTEDGHSWSWDNTGWDNIRNYNPHTGTGHAMSASGYHSKLSSNGILNIQGIWLKTDFASSFTHLHLKGYNIRGSLVYDVTLNPMDYESGYAYVTLNWVNVKSFMVDYNSISQLDPVDLSYDDMDYTFKVAGSDTKTACNSYTWIDGNTYTSNNNTAVYNIAGGASNGCDSLSILNLTILNSASGVDTRTECDPFTWIDGNTYHASNNTATFNILGGAQNGCDSLVALNLTINSIDVSINNIGNQITANLAGASYQWLDCDNNYATIPGADSQTYSAIANGNYAVEITTGGCVDTSNCVNISTTGLAEHKINSISLYPNPASNQINVKGDLFMLGSLYAIYDNTGRIVVSGEITSEFITIDLSNLLGGIYLFSAGENFKQSFLVVKE